MSTLHQSAILSNKVNISSHCVVNAELFVSLFRPGGEITPGEDEIEGLKRAMAEVKNYIPNLVFVPVYQTKAVSK